MKEITSLKELNLKEPIVNRLIDSILISEGFKCRDAKLLLKNIYSPPFSLEEGAIPLQFDQIEMFKNNHDILYHEVSYESDNKEFDILTFTYQIHFVIHKDGIILLARKLQQHAKSTLHYDLPEISYCYFYTNHLKFKIDESGNIVIEVYRDHCYIINLDELLIRFANYSYETLKHTTENLQNPNVTENTIKYCFNI